MKGGGMRMLARVVAGAMLALIGVAGHASPIVQTKGDFVDKFRQLEGEDWPTPHRHPATPPARQGYRYWQQKVDYRITARLDEATRTISASETVTYHNNSPDALKYLWLLLDQNYKRDHIAERAETVSPGGSIGMTDVRKAMRMKEWEGGFNNLKVTDASGRALKFIVVDTLLRIDLAAALASGGVVTVKIDFTLPMPETRVVGGRSGYECFTKPDQDGNCIFLGAQWFPRAAVYSDYEGWHNKAFVGGGEFTLEFGDYDVSLTVPADHVVSATGELANPGYPVRRAARPAWPRPAPRKSRCISSPPTKRWPPKRARPVAAAPGASPRRMSEISPLPRRASSCGTRWASNRTMPPCRW